MSEMPEWWPENPYPEDIFTMKRERYPEIVPDPHTRSALSGCLGREFWDIASQAIWDQVKEQLTEKDTRIKELEAKIKRMEAQYSVSECQTRITAYQYCADRIQFRTGTTPEEVTEDLRQMAHDIRGGEQTERIAEMRALEVQQRSFLAEQKPEVKG